MRSLLKEQGVPDEDVRRTILAGMDILGDAFSSCDNAIGHSFLYAFYRHSNVKDRMTRKVLFGLDDDCMAKEIIVTMDGACIPLWDDVSLFIALIHCDTLR